jgi:hypothetical protein
MMEPGSEGSREGTENVHFAQRTREHCHRLKRSEGSVQHAQESSVRLP